jgi:DNA-binding transcriptional ArsR family regulator
MDGWFVARALGFGSLIGFSLGALGAGGSILTVPILVYAMGVPVQGATGTSLAIVGLNAATGALDYLYRGKSLLRTGVAFRRERRVRSFRRCVAKPSAAGRADPQLLLTANSRIKEQTMDDSLLYERRARICQVLADPKRLRLIDALRDDAEKTVGGLAEVLGASYPNVSQHLNVMRDAGLVVSRRDGTSIYYRLAYPQITQACDIVGGILRTQLADVAALSKAMNMPAELRGPLASDAGGPHQIRRKEFVSLV